MQTQSASGKLFHLLVHYSRQMVNIDSFPLPLLLWQLSTLTFASFLCIRDQAEVFGQGIKALQRGLCLS